MSNPSCRPSKRVKRSNLKPLQVPLPKRTPAELIDAIPPPLDYEPLPHRQIHRLPTIQLPPYANTDPYSLFTLFLTEAHFETIATNTNRYAEVKKVGSEKKRDWWPTSAAEIKVFVGTFMSRPCSASCNVILISPARRGKHHSSMHMTSREHKNSSSSNTYLYGCSSSACV
jgi:hypothetical protein